MSKNLVTGYRGSASTNYTQGVFPRYNAATSHYFKNNKINLNLNYSYTNQKINRNEDSGINFFDSNETIDQIWNANTNRNTWSETHNANFNFDYFLSEKTTLSLTSTALFTPYFKYAIANNTVVNDANSNFIESFTADNLSRDDKYNIGSDLNLILFTITIGAKTCFKIFKLITAKIPSLIRSQIKIQKFIQQKLIIVCRLVSLPLFRRAAKCLI